MAEEKEDSDLSALIGLTVQQVIDESPPETKQEIENIGKDFQKCIDDLVGQFGQEQIAVAFSTIFPSATETDDFSLDNFTVNEHVILERFSPSGAWKWLKGLFKRNPATATGGAVATGAATGAGAGLMGKYLGKHIDQDVNIADITTPKPMPVDYPDLEKLMSSTNDMLNNLQATLVQTQDMLTKKLSDLDLSVDTMTAATVGTSPEDIEASQKSGARISPAASAPDEKDADKKPSPQTLADRVGFNPFGGMLDKAFNVTRPSTKKS